MQIAVPQLIKVTVLPFGIGLVNGSVTGIVVGCTEYLVTMPSAHAAPDAPPEVVPPEGEGDDAVPLLPLVLLHAELVRAIAAMKIAAV